MSIADVTDRAIQDLISLQARRAVVTGGAKGLGRAIARRLAEAGAAVLIGDIDEEGAKSAAEEMTARFGGTRGGQPARCRRPGGGLRHGRTRRRRTWRH